MSRSALSPRAAVVLVGVVLLVAVGVVLSGGGTGGDGSTGTGVTVVSGAPTVTGEPDGTASATDVGVGTGGRATGRDGTRSVDASASPAVAVVHVVGAVAHPGVVRVAADERVSDALDAAGGAAADADLTRLNLARPVVDGERLYVPRVGEAEVPAELPGSGGAAGGAGGGAGGGTGVTPGGSGVDTGSPSGGVVDLNAADATALETLPGIGPALAQRILAWREEHGGFRSVEDLLEVSGIGDGRFAELRDRVRV
jgi:competence protein ComEA